MEYIENDYNEKWIKVNKSDKNYSVIQKIIDSVNNKKSEIGLLELGYNEDKDYDDPHPYYIVKIFGGLNGPGEWTDYFDDLSRLAKKFEDKGHAWLIDVYSDCADDVFYMTFGFRLKNKG